jgi:hypothetical protein
MKYGAELIHLEMNEVFTVLTEFLYLTSRSMINFAIIRTETRGYHNA